MLTMVERGKGKEDLPRMHHERERIGGGRLTCEARIPLRCLRLGQSNGTNEEERTDRVREQRFFPMKCAQFPLKSMITEGPTRLLPFSTYSSPYLILSFPLLSLQRSIQTNEDCPKTCAHSNIFLHVDRA
jgi:hypothetical protein